MRLLTHKVFCLIFLLIENVLCSHFCLLLLTKASVGLFNTVWAMIWLPTDSATQCNRRQLNPSYMVLREKEFAHISL